MLHHVLLASPPDSEAASRTYYADLLGLTEIAKPPALAARGGCWFRGPGYELHLGIEDDFRPARKAHPAIRVGDLDALAERLTAAGRAIRIDDELPGFRRFYADDPHGNRLEFVQPVEPDWPLGDGVIVRRARAADVGKIIVLLRDDPLGRDRETDAADAAGYAEAFAEIERDPNQLLAVVEDDGRIVGTCQLTFVAGLSRRGTLRMIIEAVRVAADQRGRGLGARLIGWAIERARERGAGLVQLTTDKSRVDAHRFYERLGFVASHEGMKLQLSR
ncbi:GNAT superfamily N-acetyltransferase [Microlunatus parietis]|uniref:GNAT superfamily N-acetyltransferase n=1 Tax=Microlunatus parietis TaxID=682979 RepID=A0A7Y9LG20_9ACTN|nr:GNAT family N-acetyltransferase [Microlunatus parietis]NYE75418.1 GNAT superfamily N-acetyltransferase [Microlunatus parietis]